ncbi:MAG: lysine--tRNA ligase [Patescibacteria group bacterium]
MIWVDRTVKKILERKLPLEWVDDMKTPSGRIHVGALCGIVIHDLLYKALSENTDKTTFTYVFDDQDPMDALPSYLDEKKWGQYSGMQLYKIPSPEKGFDSFAQYYAQEFIDVFNSINCHPKIIWGSELYNSGKMNDVIKEVLDNTEKIREIYKKVTKKDRPKDWHPFSVVCENCKKIGTTLVYAWDGTDVSYRCIPDMVKWAKGCGHEGKISPLNGNGKIPWKVEWPAKWKVIGVTVEGAGKAHMSAGGSHDIAKEIC